MKTKVRKHLKVALTVGLSGLMALGPLSPVQADPPARNYGQLVGLGSDTTMDVMDGLSTALGKTGSLWRLASYKAIGSETVKTRSNMDAIPRFNGSSSGRDALYVAIGQTSTKSLAIAPNADGSARTAVTVTTAQLAGAMDFARSSSGPSSATASGVVTYVPFAIDALTYATSPNSKIPSGIPLGTDGDTTEVSLKNIYKGNITKVITNSTTGAFIKLAAPDYELGAGEASNTIKAYIPQSGSGTRSTFIGSTMINITEANISAGNTAALDVFTPAGGTQKSVQEHDGSAVANDPYALVAFSISQFVAQSNRVSTNRLYGAVVRPMAASNGGTVTNPTTGTAPNLVTNPDWAGLKRTVYNIVPTALANATGSNNIKTTFVGTNSLVCRQKTVIQRYGYGLLSYPTGADEAAAIAGTTTGGQSTVCGNILAANRTGAPSTSTVSLGTPTISAAGTSATVVATVTSNGNQGGVVKIYDGAAEAGDANLIGTGTVAKGATTTSVTVQPADKKDEELTLVAKFIPTLLGVAESTSTGTISVTVKGETNLTATAATVAASVIPTVSVTVRNGSATSTDMASGEVDVVAINSGNTAAFFTSGTLASGVASIQFGERFPRGTYTLWIRYSGSETNVPVTLKSRIVINP